MNAKHKIINRVKITFDDGETCYIPQEWIDNAYYYQSQKQKYWMRWLKTMLENNPEVTAKPIAIEEINAIVECEPYNIMVGI